MGLEGEGFSVKRNSASTTGQSSPSNAKMWMGGQAPSSVRDTKTSRRADWRRRSSLSGIRLMVILSQDYLLLPQPDASAGTPESSPRSDPSPRLGPQAPRPRPLPARARPRPFHLPLPGPARLRVGFSGPGWLVGQPPTAAAFKPEPGLRRAAPGRGGAPLSGEAVSQGPPAFGTAVPDGGGIRRLSRAELPGGGVLRRLRSAQPFCTSTPRRCLIAPALRPAPLRPSGWWFGED